MPDADTILVIDDEPQLRRAVAAALRDTAARCVVEAATGAEGIERATEELPDLVVLDLGLPDREGVDVCRELRERTSAPIVVLSARHSDLDKVQLLDAGADDYVTKPFSIPELVARVHAQLRRARLYSGGGEDERQVVTAGDLTVDLARRTATRGGEPLRLTPVEWNLLRVLTLKAGRTLTHRQLFHAVWGRTFGDPRQLLRVHVTNLRRKVERDPAVPERVVTEPGVGYRFELPE